MNAKSQLAEAEYRCSKLLSEWNRAQREVELLREKVENDSKPDRWADMRAAYERGEKCQMRVRHYLTKPDPFWGAWQNQINPAFPDSPDIEFRVKPPMRCKPWADDEIPVGAEVKRKADGARSLVLGVPYPHEVSLCRCSVTVQDMLDWWTMADGSPCGVEVEEDGL